MLKLHPQMIGRASRIAMVGDLLAYMKGHGAWIATCEEVARYVLENEMGKEAKVVMKKKTERDVEKEMKKGGTGV